MNHTSRRHFLAVTGAGAVAAGAATVVPSGLASASQAPADNTSEHDDALLDDSLLVVVVEDLRAGRLAVMHGDSEFVVTDHELATRLAGLTGKEA